MQFYYGDQNQLRVLDEAQFWKRQEAEHTTVIEQILGNPDQGVLNTLQVFQREFTQTENKATQLVETVIRSKGKVDEVMIQHIMDFIRYAIQESEEFIRYLNNLFTDEQIVQTIVEQTVINHIIRESEYFIGIAQTILFTCNK